MLRSSSNSALTEAPSSKSSPTNSGDGGGDDGAGGATSRQQQQQQQQQPSDEEPSKKNLVSPITEQEKRDYGADFAALLKEDRRKSLDRQLHNHLLNNYYSVMATQSPTTDDRVFNPEHHVEDYSLFLSESAHLSFENPNYQGTNVVVDPKDQLPPGVDPSKIEDRINCNTEEEEEEEGEREVVDNAFGELKKKKTATKMNSPVPNRKVYASLDISSMGVDVEVGPLTNLDNKLLNKKQLILEDISGNKAEIESQKLVENETEKATTTKNKDLYDIPVKRRPKNRSKEETKKAVLPPGWEKHEDENGPYFWHVKTGTIQREMPTLEEDNHQQQAAEVVRNVRSSRIFEEDFSVKLEQTAAPSSSSGGKISKSCTSSSIADMAKAEKMEKKEPDSGSSWKRRSLPPSSDNSGKIMQVGVRSLGWVELAEEELTPENSSKAVNRCIIQLSNPSGSNIDPVGQWGGGRDLSLVLDEGSLKLVCEETNTVLNSQPIHTIRVWGVGRDNGRDFAYVARDRHTRRHMCHVFRCDVQARTIANALRDICKKILIERSLAQSSSKLTNSSSSSSSSSSTATAESRKPDSRVRPTNLGAKLQTKTVPAPESFPTPMEEPRKSMKAWYLGSVVVDRPTGIDIINGSINHFMDTVPRLEWKTVMVSVAPSTVSISFMDGQEPLECRVRFLSFLGIGQNPQQCAFIVHTAQDTFVCHAFHCEPTAGLLCKTIEAACKLRYQKCLDARPYEPVGVNAGQRTGHGAKSIGATIKNMFGSLTAKARGSPQDVT